MNSSCFAVVLPLVSYCARENAFSGNFDSNISYLDGRCRDIE